MPNWKVVNLMSQEWNHPAVEQYDQIIEAANNGTDAAKLHEQLVELRAEIVRLAQLDPRD